MRYVERCVCACACMYVCTYVQVCMSIYVNVHVYVCVCALLAIHLPWGIECLVWSQREAPGKTGLDGLMFSMVALP